MNLTASTTRQREVDAGFFVPKRRPRHHQAEALRLIHGKSAFALLHAMRTGKTKILIDDFARLVLDDLAEDLLVIAPNGALPPWVESLRDDLPDAIYQRARVFYWSSGKASQQPIAAARKAFMKPQDGVPRVLLVNIEAISHVEAARELCRTFLHQRRSVAAVDESVCIKSPKSICGMFCVNVLAPRAKYRRIMSGLVAPRSPLDLYQQFKFLDAKILGIDNYWIFKKRYAILKKIYPFANRGRGVEIVVGYRNVKELSRKIAPHSHRVSLEDVYDMPQSDYSFRDVELTMEQERIYQSIKKSATAKLTESSYVTASQVIVQLLRMHQVLCGHVIDENGRYHEVPERRTDALLEVLRDYDGKAVIWCSYEVDLRKTSKAIATEFGENSVARFWGGNANTREAEEVQFKTNPECKFMVGTPDAGGKGRTWDVADLVVYYSSRNNLDHRAQSEERVKNVGKTRPISYVDLRVPGTVDDKIIEAIRKKIDMASIIDGSNWRSWII